MPALAALGLVLVLLLSACQVHTDIAVVATGGGRGTVTVTVTLDSGAVGAVGGPAALAAQLDDTDLVAAGWVVSGPRSGSGSSTVVSATHAYATLAQAGQLVGEVAGTGPDAGRPFGLSLSDRHSFWRNDTVLSGRVDLTCGVNCFGDSGLKGSLGFPTGVNPAPLTSGEGTQPAQVFTFALDARLGGSLVSSNAAMLPGGTLRWTPKLGHTLVLTAVTRTWNRARIVGFAVAGGVVVLGLLGLAVFWWRRRRRRRRRAGQGAIERREGRGRRWRKRKGRHVKAHAGMAETVPPHP